LLCQHKITFLIKVFALSADYACHPAPRTALAKRKRISTRARLALIQGWSEGHLKLSDKLSQHIDNYLTCRACESMCPAEVPYARPVNGFRSETVVTRNNTLIFSSVQLLSF